MIKKIGVLLLRIGISAALLILLFRQVDSAAIWALIRRTDKQLFAAAAGVYVLVYILCFLRWVELLKAVQLRLPLTKLLPPYAGGLFFNIFLPSAIGGDIVRSIDLAASTRKTPEVVASVLLDRLSGFTALVLVALAGLYAGRHVIVRADVYLSVAVIAGILTLVLLVLFNSFVYRKINALFSAPSAGKVRATLGLIHAQVHIFRRRKKSVAVSLLISLALQMVSPLAGFLL